MILNYGKYALLLLGVNVLENNEELDFNLDALRAEMASRRDMNMEEIPPADPEPDTTERQPKKKAVSWQKNLLMYLHDLIYLLGALMIVSLLLVRVVVVSGSSMNRTLLDGDYLFVLSNTIYHEPRQGDIVVVSKKAFDNGSPIVKRVIATGGQWVKIQDGLVYVGSDRNHLEPLTEDYTTSATLAGSEYAHPVQVPGGCIFCLGDNRIVSHDSRSSDIGMIDNNEVLGKVMFLFLPGCEKDGAGLPVTSHDYGRIGVVE